MFCQTRYLSNPFAVDHTIISFFDALQNPNFRYHGNKGRSGVNFNDTVKLHDLKNPTSDERFATVSLI